LVQRRALLAERLPDTPVLLLNGTERPRNYPGNPYPFRPDSHFLYFCGVMPAGAAAVLDQGQAYVFLEPVTPDDAVWSGPGPAWGRLADEARVHLHPRSKLGAFLDRLGRSRVATMPSQDPAARAEQEALLGRLPDAHGQSADGLVARAVVELRLRQDQAARQELRRAGAITVQAHLQGMAATRVGGDERDVLAAMLSVCARQGAGQSFQPIVTVAGERLHQPHVGAALCSGDLLLADFGAESEAGWAGDVTNTWPVSGRYTPRQREVYRVVLQAHRRAVALLRPGTRYRDVHLEACLATAEGLVDLGLLKGKPAELVERDAHALFFPHGIGHLLGLDVHDMEDLGDLAGYAPGRIRSDRFGLRWLRLDRDLEEGFAVTIEPGFYWIPELLEDPRRRQAFADCVDWDRVDDYREVRGLRIERDYLVAASGPELLTPGLPDEPEEVEAAVGGQA
jgi:Xaa-Pro aminopeptidase